MGEFRERLALHLDDASSSSHGRLDDEGDDILVRDISGPDQQAELRRRQRDPKLSFG
jgi:hypothetical protein